MKDYYIHISQSFAVSCSSYIKTETSIGYFGTPKEAYKAMNQLVTESYVTTEGYTPKNKCKVHFDEAQGAIDMHYLVSDVWCYFRVKKKQDELLRREEK